MMSTSRAMFTSREIRHSATTTTDRGAQVVGRGLGFSYGRRVPIFSEVDLTVEPGEALAIVGPSGSGKSTLLHLIAGLLKPTAGTLHIDDERVSGPSPRWNLMLQKPTLYPWLSVIDNVGLAPTFAGASRKQAKEKAASLLPLVGLEDFAHRPVRRLSGGQQQRVALARSLAADPTLLLLDEPFSALDPFTRSRLQQDIVTLGRERGLTQVLVTHDLTEAIRMSDRLLLVTTDHSEFLAGEEQIHRSDDGQVSDDRLREIRTRVERRWSGHQSRS